MKKLNNNIIDDHKLEFNDFGDHYMNINMYLYQALSNILYVEETLANLKVTPEFILLAEQRSSATSGVFFELQDQITSLAFNEGVMLVDSATGGFDNVNLNTVDLTIKQFSKSLNFRIAHELKDWDDIIQLVIQRSNENSGDYDLSGLLVLLTESLGNVHQIFEAIQKEVAMLETK